MADKANVDQAANETRPPCKVLTCDVTGIAEFTRDPRAALHKAQAGELVVFADNAPLFYALTPQRMAQLLALESRHNATCAPAPCLPSRPAVGKFAMHPAWRPDDDFQRLAALWGFYLTWPVTRAELNAFTSYWQAEGKLFHHTQWQQKLARNLQHTRSGQLKRDLPAPSLPDEHIPDGFKG